MESKPVRHLLAAVNDRAVYVYDFLRMWCFYVELIEVLEPETGASYPRLVGEFGLAPAPESREIDLGDLGGFEPEEPTSTGDAELDAYLNEDDEDDDMGYTSLDDLDHDLI